VFYSFDLLVPADTPEDDPVELTAELCYGIIHQVRIVFPRGLKAMVGIRVYRYEHQIYPSREDFDLRGDGMTVTFEDRYPLLEPPFNLKLRGYSPGTTYNHTITFRFGVLFPSAFPEYRPQPPIITRHGSLEEMLS